MYSTIKIECIGAVPDPMHLVIDKVLGGIIGVSDYYKNRWWVAKIIGPCDRYGFKREFLKPRRDSTTSNSVGSRGVYASYLLEHGRMYEVSSPRSWKRTDRFFCNGTWPDRHIEREEVIKWLRTH